VFYTLWRITWLAEKLLTSAEGLWSMKLVKTTEEGMIRRRRRRKSSERQNLFRKKTI
jgi:hypothetical protein